ncbi:MAG: triose-phosphate isomerase [Candidatus Omnitrophica bacterium]|nr:triose-phosphate isomerase [Candidatus Omnitrophota bacterium]
MRKPIIAGNWKMYKTPAQAKALVQEIRSGLDQTVLSGREVVLCPPFVDLAVVEEAVRGSGIGLGAQNFYPKEEGAFTGEVSAPMLKELGVTYVIIGHSERRQYFKEDDDFVNQKVLAALKNGLKPILCVGEMWSEREANLTEKRIETQLAGGLKDVSPEVFSALVVAYEPVWAIGTGKNATPGQAQDVHRFIRGWVAVKFGKELAENLRIQYGGSVKAENAASLLTQPDIDGALIGGASLTAGSFLSIIKY